MRKTDQLVLNVLKNNQVNRMPVWLMRQAGRYLPEYRDIRSKADSFIEFCLTPELASEATLQPIRRFGMDAAIIFADILLVPFALGQKIEFVEGTGPLLEPITEEKQLGLLKWDSERLEAVYETISLVKEDLPGETTLIGFAGSPWTVACYMIEGRGQTGFQNAQAATQNDPGLLQYMLDEVHDATLEYLGRQIEAGVDCIQLFDSHAGLLNGQAFKTYVIEPTKRLVASIKAEYPDIPIIGFPRGASEENYKSYVVETDIDCLGLDQNVSLPFARDILRGIKPLQGNMNPETLLAGGDQMKREAESIFTALGPNHIFNLGHGVIKETPPGNVAELINFIRQLKA